MTGAPQSRAVSCCLTGLSFPAEVRRVARAAGSPGCARHRSDVGGDGVSCRRAAVDRPVVLVVATDTDVEQMTGDARLFLSAMLGRSVQDADERVLPFPSQEVDPYRGARAPSRGGVGARARLHGLAPGTARLVVASARALVPRLSGPRRGWRTAGVDLRPGARSRRRSWANGLRSRVSLRKIRSTSTASSACAAASWTSIPAANRSPSASSSSATSSSPSAVTTRRRSDRWRARSHRVTPQRELLPDPAAPDDPVAPDRSATIVDYARRAGADVAVARNRRRVRPRPEGGGQWRVGRGGYGAARALLPPMNRWRAVGRPRPLASVRQSASWSWKAAPDARSGGARGLSVRAGVPRPHRRLGRRDPRRARSRRLRCCSWRPRPAAPNARSSCWPTTTSAGAIGSRS